MSYSSKTDVITPQKLVDNDPKNSLLRRFKTLHKIQNQITLQEVEVDDIICIVFKKDKWYYRVSDVALWSKCGHIKTVLFLRLKDKPKRRKNFPTFHGKEQFIFKHKRHYAVYTVHIWTAYRDENLIGNIGINKVPNLGMCLCN